MTKPNEFEVGDRVVYRSKFLRDTGQFTGWAPFAVGTVTKLTPIGAQFIAEGTWEHPHEGGPAKFKVLTSNLILADKKHLEAV
jgi:hypothetical protein